jgi:hypothetical protein
MATPDRPLDPQPNKALVAAVGTLVTTGLRWVISGEFQASDEGVVALAGAMTTVLVYAVSNYRRLFR